VAVRVDVRVEDAVDVDEEVDVDVRVAEDVDVDVAVADDVRELLPDSGLVRGRIVRCSGDAGLSLALSLCSLATQQGSWLGVVGVDHLGLLAAVEHGVALERTVLVHPPKTSREWSITVAAAIEGLDLLIVAVPERLSVNDARRVQTRLQSRRAVMIIVDNTVLSQSRSMNGSNEAQQFLADVVLDTKTTATNSKSRNNNNKQ
jgi:hypothetical protein